MHATLEPADSTDRLARVRATRIAEVARLAGLAAVYFLAGKASLEFASLHQSASPVWPPSGIALAAVVLLGPRVWPAILVGAFLVNASVVDSALSSLGIAAGNTIEALVGGWLVTRFARGRHAFESASGVLRFVFLGGLVAPIVSATLGVASLSLGDFAEWGRFVSIWLTWWIGDMVGVVSIAPLLLIWSRVQLRSRHDFAWLLETAAAVMLITLVAMVVFGGVLPAPFDGYPNAFVCFPPLLWPVFRLGRAGTVAALGALASVALLGTLAGNGPFARFDLNTSLLLVQLFTATVTVTNLVLAALVGERGRASVALQRSLEDAEALGRTERRLKLEAEARNRVEAEVAAAVENERLRLGTELHEGLGQELTGIAYLMAALHRTLRGAASEQASEVMRLEAMITCSIERTRVLAKAFYPVEMETLGLVGSLEEMAFNATRSFDIQCRVSTDLDSDVSDLRGSMAIQLFRIAEEAIYFEVKHGHARSIDISVAIDHANFVLTVAGDGVTAPGELDDVQGAGLRMMRYRAGIIGGQLLVRSPFAGGILVRCSAPLAASPQSAPH